MSTSFLGQNLLVLLIMHVDSTNENITTSEFIDPFLMELSFKVTDLFHIVLDTELSIILFSVRVRVHEAH